MSDPDGERGPLIMLVADDPTVPQVYQVDLEIRGFRVSVLTDESALFRAIDVEVPDVVVLDQQLKGVITTADIIQNFRLDERTAHTPVFVLGDQPGALDRRLGGVSEAGALAFLVKSETNAKQLVTRINSVLGPRSYRNRGGIKAEDTRERLNS